MSVNSPMFSDRGSLQLVFRSEHEALLFGFYSYTELACLARDRAALEVFRMIMDELCPLTVISGNPEVPFAEIRTRLGLYYLEDSLSASDEAQTFEVLPSYIKMEDLACYDIRCGRLMAVRLNIEVKDLPRALSAKEYSDADYMVRQDWLKAGVFAGHDGEYLHIVDKSEQLILPRFVGIMNKVERRALRSVPEGFESRLVWDDENKHLRRQAN